MSNVVLSCVELSKFFVQGGQKLVVLDKLNFEIHAKEKVAIIGVSGSGKTTLLNLLGGIDIPNSGKVLINGKDIANLSSTAQDKLRNEALGFVYQFHHLLGEFTALENVAMPLIIGRKPHKECLAQAAELLEQVGLAARMEHKPAQLSGGERQRVAIARALVNKPACVLMDEPTGNLDRQTARSIHALIAQLNEQVATSFILVTHDTGLAAQMDRTLVLQDGRLHLQSDVANV